MAVENLQRVTVKQAAEELQLAEETLRLMMQAGALPIGIVLVQAKKKRKMYVIYRHMLDAFKGGQNAGN